jgi:hypothetical protein
LEYLDRLSDLLPPAEVARVRADVESMILDRAAELLERDPSLAPAEAERRAVAALGSPGRLADEIVADPLTIPLATRRLFVRVLAVLFAGHLLLAIALTVAGADAAAVPGLLGPLPREPGVQVALAVVTTFLLDLGITVVLFVALGQARSERVLPALALRARWTRKGAAEGLVLVVLLGVIANGLLDAVFSVRHGEELRGFLSRELKDLVPFLDVVLALFALRHLLTLAGRGASVLAVGADCLASLAGAALLVGAAATGETVQMPSERMGQAAADVLDDLIERAFLVLFVLGALFLVARFVRRAMHLWHALRAASSAPRA